MTSVVSDVLVIAFVSLFCTGLGWFIGGNTVWLGSSGCLGSIIGTIIYKLWAR